MIKLKTLLTIVLISIQFLSVAQDDGTTMRSFIPASGAYDMYYPLAYELREGSDGIVTMTDTISGLNITISSYELAKKPEDLDLITMLNSFLSDTYGTKHEIEDWNSYKSGFDNLVELKTNFENTNWVWYGVSKNKSVLILSLNKSDQITEEELRLVKFMFDNLIIN